MQLSMAPFGGAFKGKRVLVTGHTGFKGSWLCEWLLSLGAEVAGFSNGVPYADCHFELLGLANRIKHFEGDVRNLEDLVRAFKDFQPEVVFHLAAQSLVRKSYEDPKQTIETNAMGTLNILEAIRQNECVAAAVLITSDKCYLNVGWDFGYRETDTLGGEDPYSASKACAEIIAYTYIHSYFNSPNSTQIATVRAGNVIGGGDWASNRIVPDCIRAWSGKKHVQIRNPNHTRPWQHVLEPLSGYLLLGSELLAKNPKVRGEAFNFGPNHTANKTVGELVTEMKKTWESASWEIMPSEPHAGAEATLLQLNCDKALNRLKWTATLSFDEAVRLTTEWYLAKHETSVDTVELTRSQIAFYQNQALNRLLPWSNPIDKA